MASLTFLGSLTDHLTASYLDDAVDRLSCLYTASLLVFCAIFISAKTHVGEPIKCWVPQTYSYKWTEFSKNYCFLKDTYWYPVDRLVTNIPESHKEQHRVQYYQWSVLYLSIAALFYMLPKFVWKMSQSSTDMPITYFCDTTLQIRKQTSVERKPKIDEMAEILHVKINTERTFFSMASLRPTVVYWFVKMLYLTIAAGQVVMLSVFLGQGLNVFWGWDLAMNLLNGVTWEKTGMFPRVTFCDFTVRQIDGNTRDETIECLLGINEFNEKMYLVIWFWFLFVLLSTFTAFLYQIKDNRKNIFLNNLFRLKHKGDKKKCKLEIAEFVEDYLTRDGQLVLSFVKSQSDVVATELAEKLFEDFINWKKALSLKNPRSLGEFLSSRMRNKNSAQLENV